MSKKTAGYILSLSVRKGETKWFDRLGELHDEEPKTPTWNTLEIARKFIRETVLGVYSVTNIHLFRVDKNGKKTTVSVKDPGMDMMEDAAFKDIMTSESATDPAEIVFEEKEVIVPEDLIERVREYTELRANAITFHEKLVSDLARYEAMQQDILHYIEFEKSTAPERMTIYAKLRDVRQERRKVKNMINVLTAVITETPVLPSETVKQIDILSTLEYKPRELKELFAKKTRTTEEKGSAEASGGD